MDIVKLRKIVEGFTSGIIGKRKNKNMCYVVCFPLVSYLNTIGYNCELVEGNLIINDNPHNHYWIKIGDVIIDPTASQFNYLGLQMPDIYIGEKPGYYRETVEK